MVKKSKETTSSEIGRKCVHLTRYLLDLKSTDDSEECPRGSRTSSHGSSCQLSRSSSNSSRTSNDTHCQEEHRTRSAGKSSMRTPEILEVGRKSHYNEQGRKSTCEQVKPSVEENPTFKRNSRDKTRIRREPHPSRNHTSSVNKKHSSHICQCKSETSIYTDHSDKKDRRKIVLKKTQRSSAPVLLKTLKAPTPELIIFKNEDFQILVRKSEKNTDTRQSTPSSSHGNKTRRSLEVSVQKRYSRPKLLKHSAMRNKTGSRGLRASNNISKHVIVNPRPKTAPQMPLYEKSRNCKCQRQVTQQKSQYQKPDERLPKCMCHTQTTQQMPRQDTDQRLHKSWCQTQAMHQIHGPKINQVIPRNRSIQCNIIGNSVDTPRQAIPIKIGSYENVVSPDDKFQVKLFLYMGQSGTSMKSKSCCPYSSSCTKKTEGVCDIDSFLRGQANKDGGNKGNDAEDKDKKGDGKKDKAEKKGKKDKKEKVKKDDKEKGKKDEKDKKDKGKKGKGKDDTEKVLSQYRRRTVDNHGRPKEEVIQRCSQKIEEQIVFKSIRDIAPANMGELIVIKNKKPGKSRDREELESLEINKQLVDRASLTEKSKTLIELEQLRNESPLTNDTKSPLINPEVCYNFIHSQSVGEATSKKQSLVQSFNPKISRVIKKFENKIKRTVSRLRSKGYSDRRINQVRFHDGFNNNRLQLVTEESDSPKRKKVQILPKSKSRELNFSIMFTPFKNENHAQASSLNRNRPLNYTEMRDEKMYHGNPNSSKTIENKVTFSKTNNDKMLPKKRSHNENDRPCVGKKLEGKNENGEKSNMTKNQFVKLSQSKVIDLDTLIEEVKSLKAILHKKLLEKTNYIKETKNETNNSPVELQKGNQFKENNKLFMKRGENTELKSQIEPQKKEDVTGNNSRQRAPVVITDVTSISSIPTERIPAFLKPKGKK